MSAAEYDVVIKDGLDLRRHGRAAGARRRGDQRRPGRRHRSDRRDATPTRSSTPRGMHVAPGFVDLHTHYDAQVFWDPYCTLSGWHGVTSVAIGNCGFGFAPVQPELREYAMRSMTRVEAIPYESMRQGMPWDWVTFPEFLDSLDATPKALNILPVRAGRADAGRGARPRRRQGRAGCRPTTSTPSWRRCSTRRWTPAAAAGRRSACRRPGRRRCSATGTARRCRPT